MHAHWRQTFNKLRNDSTFIIACGLLPTFFGVLTIVLCYHLSVNVYNRFPSWLWIPVISLLGCEQPEQTFYQIGFCLTAIATFIFYHCTFQHGLLKVLPYNGYTKTINTMRYTIILCAVGVCGQGLITMDQELIAVLHTEEGITNYVPSTKSMIHQLFALVFFFGGLIHGILCLYLYWKLRNKDNEEMKLLRGSTWFKAFMLMVSLLQLFVSIVHHPVGVNNAKKTQSMLNEAGAAQWILVFSYLAFFSTYSLDYYIILRKRRERESVDKNDDTLLMDEIEMFLGQPDFQAVL